MWQLPQTIAVRDSVYEAFGPLVAVRAEIRKRFVEEVDDRKLVQAAVSAGIGAMVNQLNDPHAVYLNQEQYQRFKKRTGGDYGGIGVDVWATEGGFEVLNREPDSPAARAGILPGEIIVHVDGRPIAGLPLVEVVNTMLDGPPGSEVTLTIERPDQDPEGRREVRLRREHIPRDPIRGWSRSPTGGWLFMLEPVARIGYIRLTKFTADAAERMDAVFNRLLRADPRGLVLDLRDNTGGLFDSGIAVADRFLESGLLVRRSGRKTDESWNASREVTYPPFPLAVLINGSSASAAELVAGALRDHGRAAIVGERSYGKASVQEVVELDRGAGAIKLTTAYYYLPGGECIHRTPEAIEAGQWGVKPTLPVSLDDHWRRRWLEAWREAAREVLPEAASRPEDPTSETGDEFQPDSAAHKLLEADLQLRTAVEYLLSRIAPDAVRRQTALNTPPSPLID
jgi:carboxyl-terminal processing protease